LSNGAIDLWDLAAKRVRATLKGHEHWVNDLAFSPDGKLLASASWDGTAKLWKVGGP
jgi:WD40 repeat protein